MKIVHIITRSDAIGGAYVHVRDLSEALLKDGHEVTVLVGGQGSFTSEFESRGIPFETVRHLVRPVRPATDRKGVVEIRRALRRLKPDIVATHSSKAGLIGRYAAFREGIPATFTAHGWAFAEGIPERSRRLYARVERWAARWCQRIITVSEADRLLALHFGVGRPDQLVAVHNGMPIVVGQQMAKPETQPPTLLMVARFEAQKDQKTLLRALAQLKDLEWKCDLIGDGPNRESCEALSASLGLSDRVAFLGTRSDVPQRLEAAQAFVLISLWEGFPLSTLEAMRAGLPTVVSDVGGSAEAVADGVTGWSVPRGDIPAVTEALRKIIVDPESRARMGTAARRRFDDDFSFERMYAKTVAVYEAAIAAKRDKS